MNSPGTKLENNGHKVEIDSEGTINITGTSLKFNGATLAGGALPTGGTTGQALVKASNADGNAAWGDVAAPTVLQHTVTLNNAQIATLFDDPVEVVPAPGAGKLLILHTAILISNMHSGGYSWTNPVSSNPFLTVAWARVGGGLLNASNPAQSAATGDFFGGASTVLFQLSPVIVLGATAPGQPTVAVNSVVSSLLNAPLVLQLDTDFDVKTGDPADTITAIIYYSVVSVA